MLRHLIGQLSVCNEPEPDVCSVLELLCNPHFVHNAILMLMNNFVIKSSNLQLQLLDTQVKRGLSGVLVEASIPHWKGPVEGIQAFG